MKLWSVILVAMLSVVHLDADARRMGGGKSIGKQSSNVTQREAAPPAAPAAPMQQNAANSAAQAGGCAQRCGRGPKALGRHAGRPGRGLGLAWLANSLGLGAAFGNFLLIALLALVVMVVIGMVMRARARSQPGRQLAFAFQGAGAPAPVDDADAAPVQPREGRQRRLGASLGAVLGQPAAGRRQHDRFGPGGFAELGRAGRL